MREIDIRCELKREITRLHSRETDTLVVEELGLCQGRSRVDVAVINGKLSGFEIKSAQDTFYRLAGQASVYNRVFDEMTIVVAEEHLETALNRAPDWWGIIVASGTSEAVTLRLARESKLNTELEPRAQLELLWRNEALAALDERNLATGHRTKPRTKLWDMLAKALKPDEVSEVVRTNLKRRLGWRAGSQPT